MLAGGMLLWGSNFALVAGLSPGSVHGLATSLATSAIPLITHLPSCSCFRSVKMFVPVCCLRH